MIKHLDLLRDIGLGGAVSARARRHVEACEACRKQAHALQRLAATFRDARVPVGRLLPAVSRDMCLPTEEILHFASPGAPAVPAKVATHFRECPDCATEFEEATLAMAEPGVTRRLHARLAALPKALVARIRDLVPSADPLPVAAIPKDITQPSSPKAKRRNAGISSKARARNRTSGRSKKA